MPMITQAKKLYTRRRHTKIVQVFIRVTNKVQVFITFTNNVLKSRRKKLEYVKISPKLKLPHLALKK